MIAVDTNVLVYATDARSRHHQRAAEALESLVGSPSWAIPAGVLFEFLAATTDPRRVEGDDALGSAVGALDGWLAAPGCTLLTEPADVWPRARELVEAAGIRGQAVHDARIAATCLAHGVHELWTADGDFLRFPELRVRNPLVG